MCQGLIIIDRFFFDYHPEMSSFVIDIVGESTTTYTKPNCHRGYILVDSMHVHSKYIASSSAEFTIQAQRVHK